MRGAVLASGSGTDFQSIIDHINLGILQNFEVRLLITNCPDAYALKRAEKHGITSEIIPHKHRDGTVKDRQLHSDEVKRVCDENKVGLILLAGYLRRLMPNFVEPYFGRIMNVHPALLPAFGGEGWFGERVHMGVLAHGVDFSGCTVHYVDSGYDTGPIVLQKIVKVRRGDTPESLRKRVLAIEHRAYSEAIQMHVDGKLKLEIRRNPVDNSEIKAVAKDVDDQWLKEWNKRQRKYFTQQPEIWLREFGEPFPDITD